MTLPTGSADELGVEALDEDEKKALDWLQSIPIKQLLIKTMTELVQYRTILIESPLELHPVTQAIRKDITNSLLGIVFLHSHDEDEHL